MRKEYSGNAGEVQVSTGLLSSDGAGSTFTTNSAAGYPEGTYPFVVSVDNGTAREKILCNTRSGTTFTVQERGYDGTVAIDFTTGATVKHVLDAASVSDFARHFAENGIVYSGTGVVEEFRRMYVLDGNAIDPVGLQQGDVVIDRRGSNPAPQTAFAARVYTSISLTIPAATIVDLPFNTEIIDTNDFHSNEINPQRLTIPEGLGGLYRLSGQVRWNAGSGLMQTWFCVNGGATRHSEALHNWPGSLFTQAPASTIVQLSAGDYVTLQVYSTSAAGEVAFGQNYSFLTLERIG